MYERGHLLLLLYLIMSSSDYTVQTRAKAQSAEFGQFELISLFNLISQLDRTIKYVYHTLNTDAKLLLVIVKLLEIRFSDSRLGQACHAYGAQEPHRQLHVAPNLFHFFGFMIIFLF